MREAEMDRIAGWITDVAEQIEEFRLPDEREARAAELRRFRKAIQDNSRLAALAEEVRQFCLRFPVPGTT
jgi:glycine/serine hydroxymethyltransferase